MKEKIDEIKQEKKYAVYRVDTYFFNARSSCLDCN